MSIQTQEGPALPLEKGPDDKYLERTTTVEVDNYHGIDVKTVLVYLALCLQSMAQLFNIVGCGAYSRSIATAVGGSEKDIWLSQAIVIVTTALGPPASHAADYFGRKWIMVAGSTFGLVGAIIVSRATSMNIAIGGQVIGSILYISQPILISVGSEILPRRYRPIAQGGLNIGGGLGAIVGLVGGSALTANSLFGWRIYWYILAGMLGLSVVIITVVYNPPPRPLQKSLSLKEKLARLDWTGYILLAVGLVLCTMGLTWGLNPYSWKDAHVLAPLLVGFVFFCSLIVHQTWFKRDGLVHHDLFKRDRNFALALGCFFIDGLVFWAANSYYTFEVSVIYETDAVLVGLHFAIAFISALASAGSVAIIASFSKRIREPIVASFALFLIFNSLMATIGLHDTKAVWAYPVFIGVGLGWGLTYLIAVAQFGTPPHLIAITSGLMLSVRSLGGSVGLAIFTAIFNSRLDNSLGQDIAAAVLPLGLPPAQIEAFINALAANDRAVLGSIPGVTPSIIGAGVAALKGAYLKSFKGVWIAAACFTTVPLIASCFFINHKSDLNNHVDAPLEEE